MRDSKGRFPPERQRRFDRAFREIERIGRGRAGSVHEIGDVHRGAVEPAEVERVRWLLVAMAHARGTPGSLAIAALARRGYAEIYSTRIGYSPFTMPNYREKFAPNKLAEILE